VSSNVASDHVRGKLPGARAAVAQRPYRPLVQSRAFSRRERRANGVRNKRVHKRNALIVRPYDRRARQGPKHLLELDCADIRGAREIIPENAVAQDRHCPSHRLSTAAEGAQPPPHRRTDRYRADRSHPRDLARPGADMLCLKRPQQFSHQQRISARRLLTRGAELRINLLAQLASQHPCQRGLAQRPRLHDPRQAIRYKRIDDVRGTWLSCAIGQRHHRGHSLKASDEKLQVPEGGLVAADDVIDADQQRRVGGEVHRQPVERVQTDEQRIGRHRNARLITEHGARPGRRARKQLLHRQITPRQHRLEQLPHHPVGELALKRRRARPQHNRVLLLGQPLGNP
jgi:hypothetical protein